MGAKGSTLIQTVAGSEYPALHKFENLDLI
jgi:hypothetical protein